MLRTRLRQSAKTEEMDVDVGVLKTELTLLFFFGLFAVTKARDCIPKSLFLGFLLQPNP